VVLVLALVAVAIAVGGGIAFATYEAQQPAACNVADVQLYGALVYYPAENGGSASSATGDGSLDQTAAEDVRQEIEAADADPGVKAILLQIDSPGGDPVAGEDVMDALRHASKPTVALVADEGTSAAYLAATGADMIFASANSSLADIGVTQSYIDYASQNTDQGLTWESLTAGQYKDAGNPDAPLTPAEKALFQRDLDITWANLVDWIAANRRLPTSTVAALADGSSMEGAMALQDGLIDKIGSIYDVEDYLAQKTGGPVTLCE